MGQAFRRAAGKLQNTKPETSPSRYQNSINPTSPIPPIQNNDPSAPDVKSNSNAEVLEDRDPSYEAMLSQMVGRINTKPGGKLEMGEAFVVEKTKRPLPKLRNTTIDTRRYEERPVASGMLNVAQLRHIMLLCQGKIDSNVDSTELKEIAEKFRLDAAQLERIFKHISLPPEDTKKKKHDFDD